MGTVRRVNKIAIVSLSAGIVGEDFVKHEVEIGLRRLRAYGIAVVFMPNAKKGSAFLQAHPEARAADLLCALQDDSVDMILCDVGGEDTYRLLPYLFEKEELAHAARQKLFLGFSDTTMNHLMLHKVGIRTFYGQAFLPDVCELEDDMLPYSRKYLVELLTTGGIREIRPSDFWYEERTDFGAEQIGIPRKRHRDRGFEWLQGAPVFEGEILGGCLESLFAIFDNTRHEDSPYLCGKYGIFPPPKDWKGKILLLETSEEKSSPSHYREMIKALKKTGIFQEIAGLLIGKPQDEKYDREYKEILLKELADDALPVVANLNVGHATPRCILPFGVRAQVNVLEQVIRFFAEP